MPNYFKRGTVDLDAAGGGSLPHARARRTTMLSVAHATVTAVPFDSEMMDTSGFYDPAAPTRLTIPAGMGGVYQIGWNLRWAQHNTGFRQTWIRHNGHASVSHGASIGPGGSAIVSNGSVGLVTLVAGDYLELLAYQDSGVALDIQANADADYTYFWLTKVA